MSLSVAMLSVHTSPLDNPGLTKDAGGMNVYIRELATELGQQNVTVDIFTRRTNERIPPIVLLSRNVRVIHIEAGPLAPVHKNELYQYLPMFIQHIEEFCQDTTSYYDLLHSHYWLSGVAAMRLARRWDVPHITMFHTLARLKQLANPNEPEPQLRLDMEQRIIQRADRIIVATREEGTQIMRICGATARQIQVVPCGVDLKLFVPHCRQQAREQLGLSSSRPVLLFVGRLDSFKGADVFLRAAEMMKEDAQIVVVGGKLTGDGDLQKLQLLADELHISPRVRFLGAQPQQKLPILYSAADLTVMPSFHESFGLVAIESLACGTPVVATRAGGLLTIVQNGKNGYLVPRCPGFFAERLDALLKDPLLLAQMRRAARNSVVQYSWKSVTNHIQDVYAELLNVTQFVIAQ